MLIRIIVALAAFTIYFSPSEMKYRRQQKKWVASDRPTLGRRDFADLE